MLEEKLRALENQYAELEARLAAPETYADPHGWHSSTGSSGSWSRW